MQCYGFQYLTPVLIIPAWVMWKSIYHFIYDKVGDSYMCINKTQNALNLGNPYTTIHAISKFRNHRTISTYYWLYNDCLLNIYCMTKYGL